MSDDPIRDHIARLIARERELELEAVAVRAGIEEVRSMREELQRGGRKRPGPKPRVVRLSEEPPAASTEPTDAA